MCMYSYVQVQFLKDLLEAWKKEIDKKAPTMSVDEALEALGLQAGLSYAPSTPILALF